MKESLSVKDTKKLNQASVLSQSDDPKKQDRARARRVEIDFKDFMRQKGAKKESFDIDPKKHRQVRRDAKIGNLARKTTNPGEKAAAEKKSKGPKLFGEARVDMGKSRAAKEKARNKRAGLDKAPAGSLPVMNPNMHRRDDHEYRRGVKKGKERKSPLDDLFREEPERTSEYKAMQASLHPRGSSEGASAHRVYGWKKRPLQKDLKVKRNRGYRKPAGARVVGESLKDELIKKATSKHKQAKNFKKWRREAEASLNTLKKGEYKYYNKRGRLVSNKK